MDTFNNIFKGFDNCHNVVNCEAKQVITVTLVSSFTELYNIITNQAGNDKQVLKEIAQEVEKLIDDAKQAKDANRLKDKSLFQKVTNHLSKHGWFYGAIMQLIGTAVLTFN